MTINRKCTKKVLNNRYSVNLPSNVIKVQCCETHIDNDKLWRLIPGWLFCDQWQIFSNTIWCSGDVLMPYQVHLCYLGPSTKWAKCHIYVTFKYQTNTVGRTLVEWGSDTTFFSDGRHRYTQRSLWPVLTVWTSNSSSMPFNQLAAVTKDEYSIFSTD